MTRLCKVCNEPVTENEIVTVWEHGIPWHYHFSCYLKVRKADTA